MSDFVRVAALSDIPDPGKEVFEVDDRFVIVIHAGGQVYCLDDVCTHDDGPLGEGDLEGYEIECPRHGAKFDIRTGAPTLMPATQPTQVHEAKIEGDDIFVRIVD
ncbi:non-heme iron oxygenase ferredoxin subunit [Bremerella alba]|uniref:Naphthalene 1,2-dioxygenase/salicylate 5-hydroxylase system, ferredoxin component n=1 Tax=Bremerella alba TaxID=980252 RepID=A0A7V8V520_9BACT|nr:non-heme iron oxygenase ferredoxin subunit [Bremerella alba]MBA2114864.1 Naphthalene 1,2-dioxygenase/salicylate 5-hydroxylase system, ferredoxin component [Bremerella alba]